MYVCYMELYQYNMFGNTREIMIEGWHASNKTDLWKWGATVHGLPSNCQNLGFFTRLIIQEKINRSLSVMIDQTLDKLNQPRSLPSVRNLLFDIIPLHISKNNQIEPCNKLKRIINM